MIPGFFVRKDEPKILFVLRILGMVILGITLAIVFAVLFGYFVMMLWNWLMPMLFGIKLITFWQAVGIIILARLIFGGFGHGHRRYRDNNYHRRCQRRHDGRWYNKWQYYEDYWKEEGEKSFDSFVERKQSSDQK